MNWSPNPGASWTALQDDEVHVWRASLNCSPAALERWLATLDLTEIAALERFRFEEQRTEFVAARGILREVLARYMQVEPASLRFSCNPFGKPALSPRGTGSSVCFNLSHSNAMALIAVARREVGVDVEYVRPDVAQDEIAEHLFSHRELSALRGLPLVMQGKAFFNCWTRKEAYVKARGQGFSIALDSFDVPVGSEFDSVVSNGSAWRIRALNPGEGYVAAVAAEGLEWSLALFDWTPCAGEERAIAPAA